MRTIFLTFILSLSIFSAAFAQEKVFNAEGFTLNNGMEVVVIPNHRTPVVTHMVWYKVGAADEPRGKSGLAHFLEHLMFKKTSNTRSGEFSEIVKALGGNENAFTSQDYTAYFQSISSEHLETVMKLEAGRMRGLVLDNDEVNSERLVIMEERRQRTENNPRRYFREQMNHALFANHPYSIPVIGWAHEIEDLSPDDVRNFYNAWYAPNNAVLVVSGDITAKELKPLAKKTYGKVKPIETANRTRTIIPPLPGQYRPVIESEQIEQESFNRLYRVPSYNQDSDISLALQVLEQIMSGGSTTRLYKSLVVEQKLATSIALSYIDGTINDATLSIHARPAENVAIETLEKAIDSELEKLLLNGVNETELSEAKTRMQDAAIFARDSVKGPAMLFGHLLVSGGKIDDIEYWPEHINNITADQIHNVSKAIFDSNNKKPSVTGYLLPSKKEGK